MFSFPEDTTFLFSRLFLGGTKKARGAEGQEEKNK